jgi:hypothetical protein
MGEIMNLNLAITGIIIVLGLLLIWAATSSWSTGLKIGATIGLVIIGFPVISLGLFVASTTASSRPY